MKWLFLNDIYAVFPPNNYHSVNISPVIYITKQPDWSLLTRLKDYFNWKCYKEATTVTLVIVFSGYYKQISHMLTLNKPQYPNTNSADWSPYISLKNWLRGFVCWSKLFPSGDHFIDSHNIISRLSIDNVERKLTLVTLGS